MRIFGHSRHVWRLILGQLVHLLVLLLPTLLLAGPAGVEWATVCFAGGMVTAAVLENHFVVPRFRANDAGVRDELAMRVALLVGLCLLGLFWAAQVERLVVGRCPLALHALGGVLLASGVYLRIAAIRALGVRFVSDIRHEGAPVRDGIYRRLRHPSEVGLLLIASGGPLLVGAPVTAASAALLLAPISLWRMHREDCVWRSRSPSNLPEREGEFKSDGGRTTPRGVA